MRRTDLTSPLTHTELNNRNVRMFYYVFVILTVDIIMVRNPGTWYPLLYFYNSRNNVVGKTGEEVGKSLNSALENIHK